MGMDLVHGSPAGIAGEEFHFIFHIEDGSIQAVEENGEIAERFSSGNADQECRNGAFFPDGQNPVDGIASTAPFECDSFAGQFQGGF